MEQVKAMLGEELNARVSKSRKDDLPCICSCLLKHLTSQPKFNELLAQLTQTSGSPCSKDSSAAAVWKSQGNAAFSSADYGHAIHCYTKALRYSQLSSACNVSQLSSACNDQVTVATLFLNRGSAMQKTGMLQEAVRDCSRAIDLHPSYSKAWYRRGQANAQLCNFQDAITDMTTALVHEGSIGGRAQIRKSIEDTTELFQRVVGTSQNIDTNTSLQLNNKDTEISPNLETAYIALLTKDKGWELQANIAIGPGDPVLHEEPHSAVILKHCRDTYCHYCFQILPGDCLPCEFCAIPLYCSENCREIAGQLEHKTECGGMSWAAVLPVEVCLAARIIIKYLHGSAPEGSQEISDMMLPNLCEHYDDMKPEDKLGVNVFAVVLALCLYSSNQSLFQLTGTTVSMILLLIVQVKINAMAIAYVASPEIPNTHEPGDLCSVQQVQIAQAIYLKGSLFNHSCTPNVHSSFYKRNISVHAITNVAAGSSLELCYGPQLGESTLEDRQRWLEERYMFSCMCKGCSKLNFPDLTLSSFKCQNYLCEGVVLNGTVKLEKSAPVGFIKYAHHHHCWELAIPVEEQAFKKIRKVACLLALEDSTRSRHFTSGQCLNCGLICDIQEYQRVAKKSWECFASIKSILDSSSLLPSKMESLICNARQSLTSLRLVLHPFNKDIAKAEDIIAEMLCMNEQHQLALEHSKRSLEVLEALYDENHITIANELVKIVSIASYRNNSSHGEYVERIHRIFSRHYGRNYLNLFPYLKTLHI